MLTDYRKENRKIAMGLLSYATRLKEHEALVKAVDNYEENNAFELFFFTPEESTNIQGIIGIEWTGPKHLVIHDLALNPSYRGEKIGFRMLDELKEKFSDSIFSETELNVDYIEKWRLQEPKEKE